MAIIYDESLSCKKCNNNEFLEETRLVFHKNVRERVSDELKLQSLSHRTVYVCSDCGEELKK